MSNKIKDFVEEEFETIDTFITDNGKRMPIYRRW